MPQVNLSTLSGPDLRRLLDSTRGRGDAALSYKILQEMAARRENRPRPGLFLRRRPAEPQIIAVDLGDPIDREDELPPLPLWRPPPPVPKASASPPPEQAPAPGPGQRQSRRRKRQPDPIAASAAAAPVRVVDVEPTPPPPLETEHPLSVGDADPEQDGAANSNDWDLQLHSPGLDSPRAPRRLRRGPAAGFAVGIAMGITLGWWVGGIAREAPPPRAAPAAAPIRTAALARQPAPTPGPAALTTTDPEPAPEALPDPAVGQLPSNLGEGPPSPPNAVEVARDTDSEAMEPPSNPLAGQNAQAVRTAETPRTAGANACATEPTPADRTICGDPQLRVLQRELRQAYTEALKAHEDRALLRQRQLAWRSTRDTVSDSDRLARLYEQRIRKLNAAATEARQQR
jgi:uncharacterized protein YecT (DUF1311 family)